MPKQQRAENLQEAEGPTAAAADEGEEAAGESEEPDASLTEDAAPEDDRPPQPGHATPANTAPETETQLSYRLKDVKMKYRHFAQGHNVEHFYLMPSGSSSASNMVEDAKVELLEQSKGAYVAFRSGSNHAEAWVFPMPEIHFTPETFKAVFPKLTAQDYETGNIEPLRAVSPKPKLWKVE
jgi:hypothetical protein